MKVDDKITYLGFQGYIRRIHSDRVEIAIYHETEKHFWKGNTKTVYTVSNPITTLVSKENLKWMK